MPLGFMPGEWDWMYRGMSTPPFFPQEQPSGLLPAAPKAGLFGRIESAAAPFGGLAGLGAQLLANSGRTGSFSEALGNSLIAGQQQVQQQDQDKLRREYMQAQIDQMRQPKQRKPIPVVRDGKVVYVDEQDAVGQEVPTNTGETSNASGIQEYREALATGFKGSYLDFVKSKAQAGYVAQEPLVAVQTPDGRSVFIPRSQAVGQTPAAPREGATPTEGERTSGNYLGRMQAAEKLLGDYKPSMSDYVAAQQLMAGGAVTSGLANQVLSSEGQQYYQAAADWVRAKLRKESGAVISPEEMAQEIKTYFPVPGDSTATIEQKRKAREQAQTGMQQMAGRAGQPFQIHPRGTGAAPQRLRFDSQGNQL